MSEEELEILKDKAENGDEEAIKKLADYYDSVGNANEAEIWKELLNSPMQVDEDESEDDFVYDGNTQNKMSEEDMLCESKKYNSGEYKKYSFLKLDETLSTNPYVNFEYGDRYRNDKDLEKAIFYYKKGIQLLETYNSNNREIQSDVEWKWAYIARAYRNLAEKSEKFAKEAYNSYQNLLEVATSDVLKVEAYESLGEFFKRGIGVALDLDRANEYTKKAHSLYVEGCLIESFLSAQKNNNIEMQKWLEKAQTVTMLGYGKFKDDKYYREILDVKLWLNGISKLDGEIPKIWISTIADIYNLENSDWKHIITNYLSAEEIRQLKQSTIDFISESLKSKYEEIEEKDILYKLITSDNFDYSTNEVAAGQMRNFLKQYIVKNINEKEITLSLIVKLYGLFIELGEDAEEWKKELEKEKPGIEASIDDEFAKLEQEKQKRIDLERQAKLAEELRLEQEKQRQIDAEKRRLAEEAEQAELEKQREKFKLELAKKECAEIEEKILKCSSTKNVGSKSDKEFFSSIKKPIVAFLAILVIINVFGMGRHDGLVVFCFIVYMLYKLLYADQPQFIVDAIKESLNVDIKTWKSENETVSHDFEILVSNSFVISDKENLKVYFGKFENCGLFTNEAGKSIVKMNGEIENYQNVWIKGYQTTFKGIMMYGALYINLDMNGVIDGEVSLDDTSLEMHNFLVEKC